LTEEDFLKSSGAEAVPKIFSEKDFKFTKLEEVLYQRITPEGALRGKDPALPAELLRKFYEELILSLIHI